MRKTGMGRGIGPDERPRKQFRNTAADRCALAVSRALIALIGLAMAGHAAPLAAQDRTGAPVTHLSAADLFSLAEKAVARGDFAGAEVALRALTHDPDVQLRSEARFRLALMLADRLHRYSEAGVLLRQLLDEQPRAARARLELARIDAMLGRMGAAGRELRAAQAAGLPPAVEQAVRFYAQALDAARPIGGSLSVSIAPDTNINHATGGSTLNTVLGNLTLSNDAQARSGIGLAVQGQGFAKVPVARRVTLLGQLSGSARIYRSGAFDDFAIGPQVGPQVDLGSRGRDRIAVTLGPAWRWYGNVPYTLSLAVTGNWQHALGRTSQLRLDAGSARIVNRRNALETGYAHSGALTFEHAWSARSGSGVQVSGIRQTAADPGYATASVGAGVYAWREIGQATLSANLAFNHLEADARLLLFTDRRVDNDLAASVGATFRKLRVGTIAPLLRLRFERNRSTVQLYDFRRLAGEVGLATSF